jgi:hypothetical protein
MLEKSSIFLMLLVGAGSLVGISSIYTPANVETQPIQQVPAQPQSQSGGVIIPKSKADLAQTDPNVVRALEDRQLLNRLMPQIIDRIDVKLVLTERPGQTAAVDVTGTGIDSKTATVTAKCPVGETIVSGGMIKSINGELGVSQKSGRQDNSWVIISTFDGDGRVSALAECLKVQLSLKGAQQPQPQQPSPPPGGPPLQPPPNVR